MAQPNPDGYGAGSFGAAILSVINQAPRAAGSAASSAVRSVQTITGTDLGFGLVVALVLLAYWYRRVL